MQKLTQEETLDYLEQQEKAAHMPDDKINMVYNTGRLNSLILGVIHAALKNMDYTEEQTQVVLNECKNIFDTYTAADIREHFPH